MKLKEHQLPWEMLPAVTSSGPGDSGPPFLQVHNSHQGHFLQVTQVMDAATSPAPTHIPAVIQDASYHG